MKHLLKSIGIASIALALGTTSCKSDKGNAGNPNPVAGGGVVEIVEYCSVEDFPNTKEFFRATASGASTNLEMSRKKAEANAKERLAGNIKTRVKAMIDNYANEETFGTDSEYMDKFQSMGRQTIDQELQGINTACKKTVQDQSSGQYTCYVALELSGTDLLTEMNNRLSADESLKVNYNYEKFKDEFNAEMDKMAAGN